MANKVQPHWLSAKYMTIREFKVPIVPGTAVPLSEDFDTQLQAYRRKRDLEKEGYFVVLEGLRVIYVPSPT